MKCAYVTLVMLGDGYVPGAVALAKSLLSSGTPHDLVCLVTGDVERVTELTRVFHRVVRVPYLRRKCGRMLTERQRTLYGAWIDCSFTKWRCFELRAYAKCVYLDADQLVLRNVDHLFGLRAPAMCFNHNYEPAFGRFRYGDSVAPSYLATLLEGGGLVGFTGTLVFRPGAALGAAVLRLSATSLSPDSDNRFNNGFEEVVLTEALVETDTSVTQLSPMYLWNAGDYSVLKNSQPYIVNYYGDGKPWMGRNKKTFMDEYIWRYFYSLDVSVAAGCRVGGRRGPGRSKPLSARRKFPKDTSHGSERAPATAS